MPLHLDLISGHESIPKAKQTLCGGGSPSDTEVPACINIYRLTAPYSGNMLEASITLIVRESLALNYWLQLMNESPLSAPTEFSIIPSRAFPQRQESL